MKLIYSQHNMNALYTFKENVLLYVLGCIPMYIIKKILCVCVFVGFA